MIENGISFTKKTCIKLDVMSKDAVCVAEMHSFKCYLFNLTFIIYLHFYYKNKKKKEKRMYFQVILCV